MATSPDWPTPRPSDVMTTGSAAQESDATQTRILVLNHHRDDLTCTLEALRNQGFVVTETRSIIDTHRVLGTLRPAVIVLNPLVAQQGSVELEVLEDLQHDDDPIPVITLIDSHEVIHTEAQGNLPIRDFITKPCSSTELLHRVELVLGARANLRTLQRRAQDLQDQVGKDFKTGLINDRHFKQTLVVEFKRAQRHCTQLSLLLVDIDEFKTVNDTTEYAFGDKVLAHVADCLVRTIRATDYAARFGGDEFALLLPHTPPREAVRTADRVREAISSMSVQDGTYTRRVTVSIGIGTFDGRSRFSSDELRRQANKALHDAKRHGKNQVWLFSETDGQRGVEKEASAGADPDAPAS